MKEKILKALNELKAKVGKDVSDELVNTFADTIELTATEETLEKMVKGYEPIFANLQKNIEDGKKKEPIKPNEPKEPIEPKEPVEPKEPKPMTPEDIAKIVADAMKPLADRLDQNDATKKQTELKTQIKEQILKTVGDSDKKQAEYVFDRLDMSNEDTAETLTSKWKEEYNGFRSAMGMGEYVPVDAKAAGSAEDKANEEYAKKVRAEWKAKDEQREADRKRIYGK